MGKVSSSSASVGDLHKVFEGHRGDRKLGPQSGLCTAGERRRGAKDANGAGGAPASLTVLLRGPQGQRTEGPRPEGLLPLSKA